MRKTISEFKDFALRGNVIDLAVGVVIGTAFGKIVSSIVSDIIMPPVGILLGGVRLGALKMSLGATDAAGNEITLNYGSFIQASVDFFIIALSIFIFIKLIHPLRREKEKETPPSPVQDKEVELLTEIRDLLKKR